MAPTDPVRRAATYDDLLELPEHVVGEIIDIARLLDAFPGLRPEVPQPMLDRLF